MPCEDSAQSWTVRPGLDTDALAATGNAAPATVRPRNIPMTRDRRVRNMELLLSQLPRRKSGGCIPAGTHQNAATGESREPSPLGVLDPNPNLQWICSSF